MTNKQRRGKSLSRSQATHATTSPTEKQFTTSFLFDGEKVTVSYWAQGAAHYRKTHEGETTAAGVLAAIITAWDVIDGDGNIMPINAETIESTGEDFQHALMQATWHDAKRRAGL